MAKYDFDDGGGSGNNRDAIKLEPPCMVRATIDGVFESSSQYGQSLGVSLRDVRLVDGIFARDQDSGNFKVLSWDAEASVPELTEDTTVDDLPDTVQRNYVGNTYKYDVLQARLEGDEDVGYGDDPEEEIELYYGDDEEEDQINDFVFFTGATDNGPKSASKTISKILAAQGRDVVLDDESKTEWLDEDVALREDLVDREVILAMTKRTADDSGRTFHHPYVLDGKTRAPIFVDNSSDDEESDEDESDDEEEEAADEEEDDMPDDLADFYSTCKDLSINQEDAVTGLLEDMLDDEEVSEESVEEYGRDEIIADLTA